MQLKLHRKASRYNFHQFTVPLFKGVNDYVLILVNELIIGLEAGPWIGSRYFYVCFISPGLSDTVIQEPITLSLHLCCTLESTLSNEELFLEQAFPRRSIVSEDVNVNEHD